MRYANEGDFEPSGCTWHSKSRCNCPVPHYALSGHNRVHYCLAIKQAIEEGKIEAKQDPI